MDPSKVIRWAGNGQFWACKTPLALCQMKDVGELFDGTPGCFTMVRWTPLRDEEELMVANFAIGEYEFLAFNTTFDPNRFVTLNGHHPKMVSGDVWLYQDSYGKRQLFFVGPETQEGRIQLLANHYLEFAPVLLDEKDGGFSTPSVLPWLTLYQPGAGRRTPVGETAWDKIAKDD